jgi:putative transposase
MVRQLRILFPGGVYHVTSRGNERKNIFRDEMDRKMLLKMVGVAKKKFGFKIFAFILMSNHYHFLFKCERTNLPLIMQYINTGYGVYFNRKYKRFGHLFQGRYKSILVEHGPDIKEVVRYIHLNPIRAGMIEKLTEYEWSSHWQYNGEREKGIVEPEHVLIYFSDDKKEAVEKYEAYMAEGSRRDKDGDEIGPYGRYIIGSDDFVRKIKLMVKNRKLSIEITNRKDLKKVYAASEITKATAGYFKISENDLITKKGRWNPGKRILIYLLARDGGMNNAGIAALLNGLHYSGIGPIIAKVDKEIAAGKSARREVREIAEVYAALKHEKEGIINY